MEIKPIRNERDHRNVLGRVEALWDCREASPECDELDVLATLVAFGFLSSPTPQ
jgi:HTH-type transcriptional regulator/antitoxin HigA